MLGFLYIGRIHLVDELPGIYLRSVVIDTSAEKRERDKPPVSGGHSTTAAVRPRWGLGETDRDERMSATRASLVAWVGCRLSTVGGMASVGAAELSLEVKSGGRHSPTRTSGKAGDVACVRGFPFTAVLFPSSAFVFLYNTNYI